MDFGCIAGDVKFDACKKIEIRTLNGYYNGCNIFDVYEGKVYGYHTPCYEYFMKQASAAGFNIHDS